ncbi:MAG: hypothetical protein GF411_09320 [Candidatus Lokiarchaeota archaeon]|nr:hypothetical protein [Candidatus Lokiarchaeota archaeon]
MLELDLATQQNDCDSKQILFDLHNLIVYSLCGLVFGVVSWIYIVASNVGEFWMWYFDFAPNRYRILQQALLTISESSATLGLLHVIIWGLSITVLLGIIQPNWRESAAILILLTMMTIQSLVLSAPGYIVLAIYAKHRDHRYSLILLPILIVIKEYLFFVAVVYSCFQNREAFFSKFDYRLITSIGFSLLMYLALVLFMGPASTPSGGVPFYTVNFVIDIFQNTPSSHLLLIAAINLSAFLFVLEHRLDGVLLFFLLSPIFIFGFFWESQLWFPSLVIIILKRDGLVSLHLHR